ncbi:cytochrome P450 family 706 subfamily A polypeptide 5 [Zea mays]|uniref:Cytochrome P450 family 706 subfamily A polypeptide 5 n=1 Tax=Zea mays TaxID=4577 RepID=A0A1D6MKN3_MAIZE|nr:cytochrome P450 family 706 subfamily A polypeptide 5 [Zea mays]
MEATAPANLFYAAFLFLSVLYLAVTRRRTSRLPPGPTGLPLVGSLPFLDRNLHACFAGLAAKYGPVFAIRLGSKVEIVVTSPELAHEVLRDKDPVFSNRVIPDAGRAVAFDGVENIVGVPVGPKWRLLRRLCAQEMLSPAGLDSLYGLRRREFRSTLRYLYSQSQAGEPVDLGALMFVNMMNVVTSTLWGGTIGSESERAAIGKEFRALVAKLTELLGTPNLSDFFPVLAPFDLQGVRKKMERIRVRFDQIFDKIIQQRVNAQQDGSKMATDFLECMLKMEREGGDGKATFTMTDVKSLLLETLRLHPALPLMVPHSPSEESTIGGFHVPAGCRVFVNVWAIHRNPLVWSEPLEFNPERFSGDDDGRRWDFTGRQFDYLPFGSGRRICAGIAMADKMTTYSLAMLLQAFDWKLPQGTELDLSEKFGVVMKKATPLMVIPKSRFPKPDLYCS